MTAHACRTCWDGSPLRTRAEEQGFEPHRDDLLPSQPLAADDPWQIALVASKAEVARIKEQQR